MVTTPGAKPTTVETTEIDDERKAVFRSATMRLAYLAQDRPELQFASKEVARLMQAPTEQAWVALKRAARFCLGWPRIVWCFRRQPPSTYIDVFTDSDHAGCIRTRRSTSSSCLVHGGHLLRTSSTTQTVISLSSGESEFYAMVKAMSVVLGAAELAKDLGLKLLPRMRYDATAGAGIAGRRGVGKIRHLHTPSLWIQKVVQDRRAELKKVVGAMNVSDIGTKHLDSKRLWFLLESIGLRSRDGRSKIALRSAGAAA